jgi:hypothetical protein
MQSYPKKDKNPPLKEPRTDYRGGKERMGGPQASRTWRGDERYREEESTERVGG